MSDTLQPPRALRRKGAQGCRCHWRALWALALAALSAPVAAAPKTDVVVLKNGDHLTGEVKSLQYNQLKFSTDHMGTVYIEWDKIVSIQSEQFLLLESTDGARYYGQLHPGPGNAQLSLQRKQGEPAEVLEMGTIVRAQPIEGGAIIDRLDGYVSAGLDLAKANNRNSVDFAGGLSSRTRIRQWEVDGSANLTDDSSGETSERYQLEFDYRQFLRNRAFYLGFAGLERNTELDLDLRTMAGGGLGRYVVQNNHLEWVAGMGLAYSHENYTGGETVDSLEGVLTTSFRMFRYDFPETDIAATIALLPSLTQSGRLRAEGDLRAKYEFIDDLYFEVKLYGSYDSEPPLADSEQSDYGLTTSLGYSF